jgi:hypothetical protein
MNATSTQVIFSVAKMNAARAGGHLFENRNECTMSTGHLYLKTGRSQKKVHIFPLGLTPQTPL